MREIRFRGRAAGGDWMSIKTGEEGYKPPHWVYGYGVKKVSDEFARIYGNDFQGGCEVYADTIGQFTGFKDMNGSEIYEGDILKVRNPNGEGGMVGIVYMEEGSWFGATDYLYSAVGTGRAEIVGNLREAYESGGGV